MIAKCGKSGKGFDGKMNYLYDGKLDKRKEENKQTTLISHSGNIRVPSSATDKKGRSNLINDFKNQAILHPNYGDGKTEFVKEHILSFSNYDTSTLTPERIKNIVDSYIQDAGIDKTQFVAISHEDTNNFHVHIVFNRVQNDLTLYPEWKEKVKTVERGVATSLQYDLEIKGDQAKYVKSNGVFENRLNHEDIQQLANEPLIGEARNLKHLEKLCEANNIPFEESKDKAYVNVNHKRYKRIDLDIVFYKNRKPKEKTKIQGTFKKSNIISKDRPQRLKPKKEYKIKIEKYKEQKEVGEKKRAIIPTQVSTNTQTGRTPWKKDEDDEDDIFKKKKRKSRGI